MDKLSDFVSKPIKIIDDFVSESIVRAKFDENIEKGMNEIEALENADKYAAKLMADRSKGALPTIFNSKNPFMKAITMFQTEVNNTVSNYTKDMIRDEESKSKIIMNYTKLFIGSHIFNLILKEIRGGNDILPDPIHWVKEIINYTFGDKKEKEKALTELNESVISSIPFVSNVAGVFGIEEVGRLPVSSAIPNLSKTFGAFGENVSEEYRNETLIKEFSIPLTYLALPFGGSQIKKTLEGAQAIVDGGSYRLNKDGEEELQFALEDKNPVSYAKTLVLGKWSSKEAQKYVDSGFKALNAKETAIYKETNMPMKTFEQYLNKPTNKVEDKIKAVENMKISEEQKYIIYKNDILSNKEREDGSSQVLDMEYAIKNNNISKIDYIESYNKAQKSNISMPDVKKLDELKENNVKITDYIEYKTSTTNELMPNYKDSKGNNIKNSRKVKVIDYLIYTGYDDNTKAYLYSKEFNNTNNIVNAGIDFDEYLNFQSNIAFLTGDKDPKSKYEEATVSGSLKKKVLNEIVKLKLSANEKLLLTYLSGYNITDKDYKGYTSNSARNATFKYIDSLKISIKDKEKLLEDSGYKETKSGKWSW